MTNPNPLLEPFPLSRAFTLRNRVVMAPMTTWAGNPDGTVSDQEDAYYRRRVKDVGLVITGCTHVSRNGIGFTDEFAAFDDRFIPSLRRLARAAQSSGAPAILQIFHAGVKAVPALTPGGDIVGPSSRPGDDGSAHVRALSDDEIRAIVDDFAQAARRAVAAGFDGVELHGAHGFLLQNFLSPRENRRTDAWGGSLENRLRFPLSVARAVRDAVAAESDRPFVLGYRVSPEEPGEGGLRLGDVEALIEALIGTGVAYVHASLADALHDRPIDGEDGRTTARRLADHIAGRVPFMVAGRLRTPEQAGTAVASGPDLAAIGQGLVINPEWMALARTGQADKIETVLRASRVAGIDLPEKLWGVIQATPGWFVIEEGTVAEVQAG